MKFPASTSTSFDDLLTIKAGQPFVLRGYEYRALRDAMSQKLNGIETVSITADRRELGKWIAADVLETRSYVAPLSEILGDL